MAVDTANEAVSPMIMRPRDSSRRCRDMEAATTPDSSPASGRAARASRGRPRLRTRGGDPPGQQRRPGPERQGRQERRVVHRDRRDPFGGQHDLIPAPHRLPENNAGQHQQPDIQVQPGPQRPPAPPDHPARAAARAGTGRPSRRGGRWSGRPGSARRPPPPRPRRPPAPASSRIARYRTWPAGEYGTGQPDGRTEHADQQGLGPGQPHDGAWRGAPDPQQRLLPAPPFPARRADDGGEQRGEDRSRQPEEQEQQFRAYTASPRAASSWALRLSPTRPPPTSFASRFLARAMTSAKAVAGSGDRAGDSLT